MVEGIQPNRIKIQKDLEQSLMLITALTPKIGYEKSCKIAQYAHLKNTTLRQAAIHLGYINEIDFDKYMNPKSMLQPE